MTDLNLPAGRDGKPRSWLMFFLRPVVLGPVTLFLLIIVAGLAYRSSRFSGIPPIDEIVNRETEGRIEIEPDENAFTFYERAFRLIPATLDEKAIGEAVDALDAGDVEWDAVSPAAKKGLEECEAVLADWKFGTEFERGVQIQPADLQFWDIIGVQESRTISHLALLKSAQCLHEGKPEEAWQWLRALFRFSRHLGNPGPWVTRLLGRSYHAMANEQLVAWASHKDVTAEQLQSALTELREINELTAAFSANLKAEYLTYSKFFSSPEMIRKYFRDECPLWNGPALNIPEAFHDGYLFLNAEPELCEVLLRHVFANHLSQCDLPRWERKIAGTRLLLFLPTGKEKPPLMDAGALNDVLMRSIMAQHHFPMSFKLLEIIDREQARQTAYELCLTVELFRRQHGEYPESLEALVPEFLDQVPRDQFGSKPTERMLMIRREPKVQEESPKENARHSLPGLIIYSRGTNETDDNGYFGNLIEDIGIRIPIGSASNLN
jgi:hypothetical protein